MARADTAVRRRPDGHGPTVPRFLPIASLALTVAGLAIAAYLTYEHYTASTTLACSDRGVVNCLKVTSSAQSRVLGIPVAVLGLVFFVAMLPLCLPAAWRHPAPLVRRVRLGACGVGVGFVLYLLYAELFVIGNICLWCTGVHVITVALFGIVLIGGAAVEPPD